MKIFKKISIVALFLFSTATNAQVILTHLGHHPFFQPQLTSISDLRNMIEVNKDDIKAGLNLAGLSEIYEPFMEQLPNTEIEKVYYKDGTKFDWMFHRKKGKGQVLIAKDVTWINKKSIEAYQFHIDTGEKRYTFAVPLICSNLSLRGVTKAPIAIIPPVLEIKEEAAAIEQEMIEAEEVSTSEPTATPIPIFAEPKIEIEKSQSNLAVRTTPASTESRLNFLADIGYLHQFDPAYHLLARIGAEIPLNDNLSLLGLIGAAPLIKESEGKDAYIMDFLIEYKFAEAFFDLGIGGWKTDGDENKESENSQLDIILALGTKIFGETDGFNVSLFVEARNGINEIDSYSTMSSFGRWGGGLRFKF